MLIFYSDLDGVFLLEAAVPDVIVHFINELLVVNDVIFGSLQHGLCLEAFGLGRAGSQRAHSWLVSKMMVLGGVCLLAVALRQCNLSMHVT